MRRRWFFGLLPAAAAAQTVGAVINSECKPEDVCVAPAYSTLTGVTACLPNQASPSGMCKPANGECPACGTMAPAIKRQVVGYRVHTVHQNGTVAVSDPIYADGHSVVECSHCRCVFGMDAEADDER